MGAYVTAVASSARTTSSNSGTLPGFGDWSRFRAQLAVTAASGTTPTLDVVIEDSLDGTNWNTVATFTQKTAAGVQAVDVTGLFGDQLRVRWTVGGTTPSFTFAVLLYGR
jgi:hypothetical protein